MRYERPYFAVDAPQTRPGNSSHSAAAGRVEQGGTAAEGGVGAAVRKSKEDEGGRHAVGIPFVAVVLAMLGWSWHVHVVLMDAYLLSHSETLILGLVREHHTAMERSKI